MQYILKVIILKSSNVILLIQNITPAVSSVDKKGSYWQQLVGISLLAQLVESMILIPSVEVDLFVPDIFQRNVSYDNDFFSPSNT